MSYSILYRSLFVKVSNNRFIPLYECGDNNCYEVLWNGRMRRDRSWSHFMFSYISEDKQRALPFYTSGAIMDMVQKDVKDAVYCGTKVSGKSCTDEKDIINYWKRAINRARTMEDLCMAGVTLVVKDANYHGSGTPESPSYKKEVANEEELVAAWNECVEKCGNAKCTFVRDVSDYAYKKLYPPKPKVTKEHTAGYTVTINGYYILKATPRRFRYTYGLDCAHIYPQRATAEKLQQRIQRAGYSSEVRPVSKNANGKWEEAA